MLKEKKIPWASKLDGFSAILNLASMVFNGISQNSIWPSYSSTSETAFFPKSSFDPKTLILNK